MPAISINIAEIDKRLAAISENLRNLVEQAAANSGAADEELMSERIAEQEAEFQRLTKQRDEFSKSLFAAQSSSSWQAERSRTEISNRHKMKRRRSDRIL
jgi:hypothetical protein